MARRHSKSIKNEKDEPSFIQTIKQEPDFTDTINQKQAVFKTVIQKFGVIKTIKQEPGVQTTVQKPFTQARSRKWSSLRAIKKEPRFLDTIEEEPRFVPIIIKEEPTSDDECKSVPSNDESVTPNESSDTIYSDSVYGSSQTCEPTPGHEPPPAHQTSVALHPPPPLQPPPPYQPSHLVHQLSSKNKHQLKYGCDLSLKTKALQQEKQPRRSTSKSHSVVHQDNVLSQSELQNLVRWQHSLKEQSPPKHQNHLKRKRPEQEQLEHWPKRQHQRSSLHLSGSILDQYCKSKPRHQHEINHQPEQEYPRLMGDLRQPRFLHNPYFNLESEFGREMQCNQFMYQQKQENHVAKRQSQTEQQHQQHFRSPELQFQQDLEYQRKRDYCRQKKHQQSFKELQLAPHQHNRHSQRELEPLQQTDPECDLKQFHFQLQSKQKNQHEIQQHQHEHNDQSSHQQKSYHPSENRPLPAGLPLKHDFLSPESQFLCTFDKKQLNRNYPKKYQQGFQDLELVNSPHNLLSHHELKQLQEPNRSRELKRREMQYQQESKNPREMQQHQPKYNSQPAYQQNLYTPASVFQHNSGHQQKLNHHLQNEQRQSLSELQLANCSRSSSFNLESKHLQKPDYHHIRKHHLQHQQEPIKQKHSSQPAHKQEPDHPLKIHPYHSEYQNSYSPESLFQHNSEYQMNLENLRQKKHQQSFAAKQPSHFQHNLQSEQEFEQLVELNRKRELKHQQKPVAPHNMQPNHPPYLQDIHSSKSLLQKNWNLQHKLTNRQQKVNELLSADFLHNPYFQRQSEPLQKPDNQQKLQHHQEPANSNKMQLKQHSRLSHQQGSSQQYQQNLRAPVLLHESADQRKVDCYSPKDDQQSFSEPQLTNFLQNPHCLRESEQFQEPNHQHKQKAGKLGQQQDLGNSLPIQHQQKQQIRPAHQSEPNHKSEKHYQAEKRYNLRSSKSLYSSNSDHQRKLDSRHREHQQSSELQSSDLLHNSYFKRESEDQVEPNHPCETQHQQDLHLPESLFDSHEPERLEEPEEQEQQHQEPEEQVQNRQEASIPHEMQQYHPDRRLPESVVNSYLKCEPSHQLEHQGQSNSSQQDSLRRSYLKREPENHRESHSVRRAEQQLETEHEQLSEFQHLPGLHMPEFQRYLRRLQLLQQHFKRRLQRQPLRQTSNQHQPSPAPRPAHQPLVTHQSLVFRPSPRHQLENQFLPEHQHQSCLPVNRPRPAHSSSFPSSKSRGVANMNNARASTSRQSSQNRSASPLLPSKETIFGIFTKAVSDCRKQTKESDRLLNIESFSDSEWVSLTLNNPIARPPIIDLLSDSKLLASLDYKRNFGEEEVQAIERLMKCGFSSVNVTQAYILCAKDEDATLDYLLAGMC